MTQSGRRIEFVLSMVFAVLALFWVVGVIVAAGGLPSGEGRPDLGYLMNLAAAWTLVAAPWIVAIRLLWRAWWRQARAELSTMDGPARLLVAAIALLPGDQRDWGAAMTAELAHVSGRSARWSFAAGCVRAVMLPPRKSRVPALLVASLAMGVVVAAGLAVGWVLPAMQVFVVTFVVLVGALATLAIARSPRVQRPAAGLAIAGPASAGVAVCIAVVGYWLVQYPTSAAFLSPALAVFVAAVLAGCVSLALRAPRGLTTSRLARHVAVGMALLLGVGLVVASRLGLNDVAWLGQGLALYLVPVPILLVFAGSAIVAAIDRSFRAGVQAAVWTALLGSLAVFAVGLLEALIWFRVDSSLIFAADAVPLEAVGENLRGFAWGLILLPYCWLPFGVIGAGFGNPRRTRRHARPLPARRSSEPQRWTRTGIGG